MRSVLITLENASQIWGVTILAGWYNGWRDSFLDKNTSEQPVDIWFLGVCDVIATCPLGRKTKLAVCHVVFMILPTGRGEQKVSEGEQVYIILPKSLVWNSLCHPCFLVYLWQCGSNESQTEKCKTCPTKPWGCRTRKLVLSPCH